MTTAVLPRFVRRSPIALLATILLTLLVAVVEVPVASPRFASAPAIAA
jgi:hypothetical protein